MRILKTIGFWVIQATWGFPQFILGGFAFLILLPFTEHFFYRGVIYTVKKGSWGGLSMGAFVFIDTPYNGTKNYKDFINHEFGHSIESLILGIFWLFIIGIPSILWAGFFHSLVNKLRKSDTFYISYYALYTEKWADKLGGVIRIK